MIELDKVKLERMILASPQRFTGRQEQWDELAEDQKSVQERDIEELRRHGVINAFIDAAEVMTVHIGEIPEVWVTKPGDQRQTVHLDMIWNPALYGVDMIEYNQARCHFSGNFRRSLLFLPGKKEITAGDVAGTSKAILDTIEYSGTFPVQETRKAFEERYSDARAIRLW